MLAKTETRTPLPKFQLFCMLMIQLSEPITATVIYPFITEAVVHSGITAGDEKRTGYYAGIIESAFFVSECVTVVYWGRLSDKHGRRPILLLGPLGLAISVFGFGLSNSFWPMVIFRCGMGIFNGNIGVSKTMTAEMTDDTNRADAFALACIVWALGTTVGPTLGGVLADPTKNWPHTILSKVSFFRDFPYFLSCAAAGMIALAAFLLSYLGLKESAPSMKRVRVYDDEREPLLSNDQPKPPACYGDPSDATSDDDSEASSDSDRTTVEPVKAVPIRKLLNSKLRYTVLSVGIMAFTDMAYQVLIPLVYSTSISAGGLGLDPYQIGLILGIFGLASGVWNWLVLNRILKMLGPRRMFIVGYACFLIHFALLAILREAAGIAGKVTPFVWFILVLQLFLSTVILATYNGMHLTVIMNAPADSLGAVNGLAQMMGSGARGIAPVFASSLFSISLESSIANGHLVEILLMGITIVGIFFTLRLPH